ncbi:MAG TPA: sigma-70 family RNA polymerase sigma factor [Planctomycetota bacterium]|nr:sigma-70 family RNA polymerase sigma factor [Planctomycetota bacterium]
MTTESFPIRAESLLQHREFVRALARSLVRDEHSAQDVVQETWLEALRHPPRNAAALSGWLARVVRSRAQNVARGESRRVVRERSVAREELDESDEKLHERVAMQHKVVEAVLALKEPYKTVVLLHYYEGLSPSQIAARRNTPAGSVRAQLSRAHDLLRERLDAEFGGSRAAWSVGLAALARGRTGMALAAKVAALAAFAAAVAVPVVLWVSKPARELSLSLAVLEPSAATPAAIPSAAPEPGPEAIPPARVRSAVPSAPAAPQILPNDELESQPVRQLLQLAIHVQQTLRTKLLTPAEELKKTYASLLTLPDTGLAKLLHADQFGNYESNALGMRGAGSCFSFVTRKQGWDDEPDLQYEKGDFHVAGYGPGVLDLGERRLEDLPNTASPDPAGLGPQERASWEVHWADCGLTEKGVDPSYLERARGLKLPAPKTRIGHAYLVRGITHGAHDVLAAFTPIAQDEYGWTIAWRVLHTWPVQRNRGEMPDPLWIMPDPPAFLASQSVEALVDLFGRIRTVAQAKLFEMPAELKERIASLQGGERTGVARLLTRGRYDAVIEKRGGGCYYSFASGENDYDREPDIELEQGMYRSGFYGSNTGLLLDLGAIPIDSVGASAGKEPAGLNDRGREVWQFLWALKPVDGGRQARAISGDDEATSNRLELRRGVGAEVGHTYLLRSVLAGEHDVLAVFTTAARDEHGDWIAYRVIWNRKLATEPKPR